MGSEEKEEGRAGKGFCTLPGVRGDVGPERPDLDTAATSLLRLDSVGSSKGTV